MANMIKVNKKMSKTQNSEQIKSSKPRKSINKLKQKNVTKLETENIDKMVNVVKKSLPVTIKKKSVLKKPKLTEKTQIVKPDTFEVVPKEAEKQRSDAKIVNPTNLKQKILKKNKLKNTAKNTKVAKKSLPNTVKEVSNLTDQTQSVTRDNFDDEKNPSELKTISATKLKPKNKKKQKKNLPKNVSNLKVEKVTNGKKINPANLELETKSVENIPSELKIDDDTDSDSKEVIPEKNVSKKKIDPEQNEKTVFVGNIPPNSKINHMKTLFSMCTITSCRFRLANGKPILKHKMRKNADSINAWVVFDHKKDVELAVKLNGIEYKGKHIRVSKSNEKPSSNDQNDKCSIFVGNLKYSANDDKLYSIFSCCGDIEFVRTIKNDKGCSGVAYVCFKKPESVGLALELNSTLLDDRPIHVEKYSKNKSGASKKRTPEKEMSGVERRILSKLMTSQKLPFNNFGNKTGLNKKLGSNKKFNGKNKPENGKKKSEFRGIKVDSKKKFKKNNNKHPFHALAKKIAPKE